MPRWVFTPLALLIISAAVQAQVRDVKVSAPTRIDWAWAVQGFGKDAGKLPDDYDSAKQKYQLFLPKNYKADKTTAWPLVIFISPSDQPMGLSSWRAVCEKHGALFCSPYKAGNNVAPALRTRIILDMFDDVRRHHRIDANQTYISGFSGGGRMACAIGFALPEYFGGVAPVCGTNPITGPAYLRHRIEERLSVAFITGEKDFNRKENEEYMYKLFQDINVRTMLRVVPQLGHAVPSAETMEEVYTWLDNSAQRRRDDAKARPGLAVAASEAPSAVEQAKGMVEAAQQDLKIKERAWKGVALLQGAAGRWPKTEAGQKAKQLLKEVLQDPILVERIAEQGGDDEQQALSAQARALERFGQTQVALQLWENLAKNYPDTPTGKLAKERIAKLKGEKN